MITNDDRAEAIQAAANEIANVQTGQPKGSRNAQWREYEAEGQAVVDRLQALFDPPMVPQWPEPVGVDGFDMRAWQALPFSQRTLVLSQPIYVELRESEQNHD